MIDKGYKIRSDCQLEILNLKETKRTSQEVRGQTRQTLPKHGGLNICNSGLVFL